MTADLTALLYLVAGVLFILALRGLSSPETSRRGNQNGMLGMVIAVLTTLAVASPSDALTWGLIFGGVAIGGRDWFCTTLRLPGGDAGPSELLKVVLALGDGVSRHTISDLLAQSAEQWLDRAPAGSDREKTPRGPRL